MSVCELFLYSFNKYLAEKRFLKTYVLPSMWKEVRIAARSVAIVPKILERCSHWNSKKVLKIVKKPIDCYRNFLMFLDKRNDFRSSK